MKSDYGNKMKDCLWMLDDCEFNTYSLQLGVYKKMIEMNTNIKLGKSYLVWLSHNNDDFEIIPTKDRRVYVDQMFNKRIADLVA